MTLHLRCNKCDFLDIVKYENGKSWKCPNCEFNQPERSKREDHHLSLEDFSDNPSLEQFGKEMREVEKKILDAVL